ncbi:MAG: hypothetical protein R6X13_02165 [bacterium]
MRLGSAASKATAQARVPSDRVSRCQVAPLSVVMSMPTKYAAL